VYNELIIRNGARKANEGKASLLPLLVNNCNYLRRDGEPRNEKEKRQRAKLEAKLSVANWIICLPVGKEASVVG
jgi:hypothetical protein